MPWRGSPVIVRPQRPRSVRSRIHPGGHVLAHALPVLVPALHGEAVEPLRNESLDESLGQA